MISILGCLFLTSEIRVMPLFFGMIISVTMISGSILCRSSVASSPFAALSTSCEARCKTCTSMSRTRLSSSTNKIFAMIHSPILYSGNKMMKVVPTPNWLLTTISPWCSFTVVCTVANPKPVPLPTSLVVKKGSKIRDRVV